MISDWSADETVCLVANWKEAMVRHNINEILLQEIAFFIWRLLTKWLVTGSGIKIGKNVELK